MALPVPWTGFNLGSSSSINTINGDVAEVLVYDRALTDQELANLSFYLFLRYGIATPTGPPPSASTPISGIYTTPQTVAFDVPSGFTLRYTIDGSTPAGGSGLYSSPLNLNPGRHSLRFRYQNSATGQWTGTTRLEYIVDPAAELSREGLVAWFRGDGTTISAGAVHEWIDFSANPTYAVKNGSYAAPTVVTGPNGKSVLQFQHPLNSQLIIPSNAKMNFSNMSLFAVVRRDSPGLFVVAQRSGTGDLYALQVQDNITRLVVESVSSWTTQDFPFGAYGLIEAAYWQSGNLSAKQSLLKMRVNGIPRTDVNAMSTLNASSNPLYIGGLGAGYSLQGEIAEILLFNRLLTLQERGQVETYLGTRYALTTDADGDGLANWKEEELGSDPNVADTNGNGLNDGAEYSAGFNPTSNDVDNDGLTNAQEIALGTNPFWNDTDGDGVWDGADAYPFDPSASSGSDPTPTVAPVITLELPTNATLLP